MSMKRKEEIVLVTLELAAQKGLAGANVKFLQGYLFRKKPESHGSQNCCRRDG